MPTRANILRGMRWLVENARPGDRFFLHYSGHGGFVEDYSEFSSAYRDSCVYTELGGDEVDGKDETILPVDHEKEGQIVDDVGILI
jgi:hypothetical protein